MKSHSHGHLQGHRPPPSKSMRLAPADLAVAITADGLVLASRSLLERDARARITMPEIKAHPWMLGHM